MKFLYWIQFEQKNHVKDFTLFCSYFFFFLFFFARRIFFYFSCGRRIPPDCELECNLVYFYSMNPFKLFSDVYQPLFPESACMLVCENSRVWQMSSRHRIYRRTIPRLSHINTLSAHSFAKKLNFEFSAYSYIRPGHIWVVGELVSLPLVLKVWSRGRKWENKSLTSSTLWKIKINLEWNVFAMFQLCGAFDN